MLINNSAESANASDIGHAEAQWMEKFAAVQLSEARFRSLAHGLQVGILIQLANAEIVLSNPKALELLGLTQDQLHGKTSLDPDWNVIHPDGSPFPGPTHPVPQAIATARPVHNVEMGVFRPATGDRVWLLVNADPQLAADGSVLQVVCTFSDISGTYAAREARETAALLTRTSEIFQEREAFTQSILNSVPAEIAVLSRNGTIVAVNEGWRRFARENGLPSGELPAKTDVGANYLAVCEASGDDSVAGAMSPLAGIHAVLNGSLRSYAHEYPCHSPDAQRWFQMQVTPFEGSKILGAVVTHTDITQRKLAEIKRQAVEAELKQAQHAAPIGSWHWPRAAGASSAPQQATADRLAATQERLQLVIDATDDGIWDWHVPSGWVFRSPRYLSLVGAAAQDDTHDLDFFMRTVHSDDLPRVTQTIQDHLEGRTPFIVSEYRLATAAKHVRWLKARGRIVSRDASGAPLRLVGTLSDITERKNSDMALQQREQQLARVLEGSNQGFWDLNVQTKKLALSARMEEMLGYAPGEMNIGMDHWAEHMHPDDLQMVFASIDRQLAGQSAHPELEMRMKTKRGEWRWFQARGRIVSRDDQGAPLMMSGTHTDITEQKQLESALKEAATVFSSSYEGIMVVSPDMLITKVNPAFSRITGYSPDEAVGQSPQILSSGKHDAQFYWDLWSEVTDKGFWSGEIWDRRKNGELYSALMSISAVRSDTHAIQRYVGVFTDISKFKAHEQELDRIAHFDPLTGSPNRRLLADRLDHAISHSRRTERNLAVCVLDIDNFKFINDAQGHPLGDLVLVGVSENLKRVLRAEDTLARIGGDEFVLLLAGITSTQECSQILDRVLDAVSQPILVADSNVAVTASIGVSLFPDDNADADTLLRHADQAMYQAKEAGKNRYCLFDLESNHKAQTHRSYLGLLRAALQGGQFELHFQPKVNLRTGEIVGAEALIRWRQPGVGLVSPADFLPHIYGSDLEVPLGEWVIQTALGQAARWRTQGLNLCVSVNISARHLLDPGFHDSLVQALAEHPGLPASCFELEVLETAAIADIDLAVGILTRCRALGVQFALDDFGTGYSSLTYLRKLPVDTLKIDQSFVRDMLSDAEDMGIVEGVIRLGEAFRRNIIAEGVETLTHGAALLSLNCYLAQGYGIARPMAAGLFADWTATWTAEQKWLKLGAGH
jgi:diguanylate cyclase (GGDEF)-like protein/PAS domain S-box-containing protein